jgi:hypothetical protein
MRRKRQNLAIPLQLSMVVAHGFENCVGPSFPARYMDKMLDGKAIFPALSQGDHE